MLITTTNNIEGRQIKNYKGIVCGEVITGVNFLKDFMAGIRDLVGGRSQGYEEELIRARNEAIDEMINRADLLGCNAIVGVDIDYEVLGQGGGMLMVTASGTGVITE